VAGIEAARLLREVFERELDALERESGSERSARSIRSSQSGVMAEMGPSDASEGLEGSELRGPLG
jgi:hypothetical protein